MGVFHQTYHLLATPTMPIPAFRAGQPAPDGWPSELWTSWTPYTYPFNLTQQPDTVVHLRRAHGWSASTSRSLIIDTLTALTSQR